MEMVDGEWVSTVVAAAAAAAADDDAMVHGVCVFFSLFVFWFFLFSLNFLVDLVFG